MQKTKEQLGEEFWQRIETLMGDERPYSWCARVGINKGSFQSAYNRRARPLDQTIAKWADKIGVSSEWLKTGIDTSHASSEADVPLKSHKAPDIADIDTDGIDMDIMIEALTIVESYLIEQNKRMQADKKAELVVSIYDLLCKSPDAGSSITAMLKLAV